MTQAADQSAPPSREPLGKAYRPAETEPAIWQRWIDADAFHADPKRVLDGDADPYCILIPPPNVTAALHLGHALNNTLQDVLIRAHRMMGFETLWMPGTDHAGIATQTVVDKRLKAEGKPALAEHKQMELRGEPGREQFTAQVQEFKDEFEARITAQLQAMGCSCDWDRQRFTMDAVCARSVREAFFRLFKAGLIYRGKRLVNWDPATGTALSDDEVDNIEVEGFFYYLDYPVVDDAGNETGEVVTVATTRPETYFGDTAIAVNANDPERARFIGKSVKLPFVNRVIKVIADDYVVVPDPKSDEPKAKYASGFLKVTPAHDPNDWLIGQRHNLDIINVMAPDASISADHGWEDVGDATPFLGLSREDARQAVVDAFKGKGLLRETKPYAHSVGHSYRSHVAIEPYLSDQWYCKVTDDRLRGSAQRALKPEQRSEASTEAWPESKPGETVGDAKMTMYPARYAKTYETWHDNLRDWCISRQLWWGHRIPIWYVHSEVDQVELPSDVTDSRDIQRLGNALHREQLDKAIEKTISYLRACGLNDSDFNIRETDDFRFEVCARTELAANSLDAFVEFTRSHELVTRDDPRHGQAAQFEVSGFPSATRAASDLEDATFSFDRDPDVLDTWFSSALWPLSTMGWPDADAAGKDTGIDDFAHLLAAFNPTSVLCTAREIITLWVSRMVMFNRLFMEQDGNPPKLPYKDVFIHAMIQDGDGRKMSKSLGNGVDPLDIIHSHGTDAMRFTLVQMTTQTQDVRMPVQADPETGKNTSPKFDVGRNFCNKLWNASRFAIGMLASDPPTPGIPIEPEQLSLTDRWMLSRIAGATTVINGALKTYQFKDYADALYDLLWRDFCDWYLEAIKPTIKDDANQRAVLRLALDAILRLLHPVAPFITEAVFERLREIPMREIDRFSFASTKADDTLCQSGWPAPEPGLRDEPAEEAFSRVQALVTSIREVRASNQVPPKRRITLHATKELAADVARWSPLVETLAGVEAISTDAPAGPAAAFTFEGAEHKLSNLADAVDAGAERERLTKQIAELDGSIAKVEGRLSNPGYVERAPEKLVNETRAQLEQLKADRATTAKALEDLA